MLALVKGLAPAIRPGGLATPPAASPGRGDNLIGDRVGPLGTIVLGVREHVQDQIFKFTLHVRAATLR